MQIVSRRAVMFFDWLLRMNGSTAAITIFPFIFIHPDTKITKELINHERIHLIQQMELLVLPFYIWYLIALNRKGYWNISHEREAYENERNLNYLKTRRPYSFLKY